MFGFRRKKKATSNGTSDTFVEATGGGWSDLPDTIPGNGGTQADFVGQTLERARAYALENDVAVGQEFQFIITDIPTGISSPHEIIFGLMMQAGEYGLSCRGIANEKAHFTRLT